MNHQTISTDADIRLVVNQVTLICTSREFSELYAELLSAYANSGDPDPETSAFHDALFSLMAENNLGENGKPITPEGL